MLDIPNDRSSHVVPTPRGGGLSMVLIVTTASFLLAYQQKIPLFLFAALMGGVVIALIGWLDDRVSIAPHYRAAIHIAAAIWAVYWLGGLSCLNGGLSYLLAIVGIVWCVNLYNFMDGIDGLAGAEGLFMSLSAAVILGILGVSSFSTLFFILSGAIAGFLVWNFPPAKIFMGDVGSGYLGYIFSVLAIATANLNLLSLPFWMILAAIFLCDATFTVLSRMYQGERWYEAHREHAYQYLIRNGASHKMVTISVLLVNIFILLPMACLVLYYSKFSNLIFGLAVLGLFLVWNKIRMMEVVSHSNK